MANKKRVVIPTESIEGQIVLIRGQKVMLDVDLAVLYGVQVKALNQAVRRNIERFPEDFMFQLTAEEVARLRSQIVTLKTGDPDRMGFDANASSLRSQIVTSNAGDGSDRPGRGGRRYRPYAFTEQGVAMLSSVLRSRRAVLVNVEIMRAFVRLRQILASHAELGHKLATLEKRYDAQFKIVFDAIRELMAPPKTERRRIGFEVRERRARYGRHATADREV